MKLSLKHSILLICTFCWFCSAYAQNSAIFQSQPNALFDSVVDMFGNKYSILDLAVNDTLRAQGGSVTPNPPQTYCTTGYFNLFLQPGCGLENWQNSSLPDAARLAVVCRVLQDISNFISSPCANSSQKINIWVKSFAGLTGSQLGGATSFYNVPVSQSVSGIVDNTIWLTLRSGIDAYSNVFYPVYTVGGQSSGFYHGYMEINFSNSINWNLSLTSPPGSGEYDLYSVVLHEMLHALGFRTLIDYNGSSITGFPYYSRYDQHLQTQGSTPLISQAQGVCNNNPVYNYSYTASTSVLSPNTLNNCSNGYNTTFTNNTICSTAVKYVGGNSLSQDVYTPDCYEPGSSLSHFDDQCQVPASFTLQPSNNQYFLMSASRLTGAYNASTNPGAMIRYPKPEERQVLCDLGYTVGSSFGNSANTYLNYYSYSAGACSNNYVVGVNDGISGNSWVYNATVGNPCPIPYTGTNGIINNDYGVTSAECPELVIGGGTITSTSNGFNYTPSTNTPTVHLLRYVPVSSTGVRGNITYIYVHVSNGNCIANPCNMVNNGEFENATSCGSVSWVPTASIDCWEGFWDYLYLWTRNCSGNNIPANPSNPPSDTHLPTTGNNHFIGVAEEYNTIFNVGTFEGSGIQTTLNSAIIQNGTYTVTFWAKVANGGTSINTGSSNLPTTIEFAGSASTIVMGSGPTATLPAPAVSLTSVLVPADNNWHILSSTFTYTGTTALNNFIIYGDGALNPSGYPSSYSMYAYVDGVSLMPANNVCTFTPPSPISTCDVINDLSQYVSVPGGVFAGNGVVLNGNVYNFSGNIAGQGLQTISYTYTTNCSTQVVYAQVLVTASLTASANPTFICPGDLVTLTASNGTNYNWTATPNTTITCQNAACSTATAHPTVTTVFNVTDAGTNCSINITVNVLTANITAGSLTTFCAPGSVVLSATPAPASGLTYQWQLNGVNIPGAQSQTYTASGSGTYTCVLALNGNCSSTSNAIVVTATPTPSPTISPSNPSPICFGNSVTLSANTSSGYTYLWYFNGASTFITASSYVATVGGSYTVKESYQGCSAMSNAVSVTVNPSPSINGQPVNSTLCAGANTSFSISASGSSITYQWQVNTGSGFVNVSNGGVYSGATTSTLNITGATSGMNGYSYRCVVTNSYTCSVTSSSAILTVNPSPSISGPASFCQGSSVTLNSSTCSGCSYQWQLNGSNIVGATNPSYTTSAGGSFTVTNSYGCTSAAFIVTVNPLPTASITTPMPYTICAGSQGTFTLNAYSNSGYSYQWQVGGVNINNTFSNPVYTNYNSAALSAGSYGSVTGVVQFVYNVVVTNSSTGCQSTSGPVTVSIIGNDGSCNPCSQFNGNDFEVLGMGGSINSDHISSSIAKYYLPNTVSVSGNIHFQNAVLLIGYYGVPVLMNIAAGSVLNLNHSHLYACDKMWGGIVLNSNSNSCGQLNINGNTMIEDALTAVSVPAVQTANIPNGGILNVNDAIFNRNDIGVDIESYAYQNGSNKTYPFSILNTVFTSRDYSGMSNYPLAWPVNTGSGGLKAPYVPVPPNSDFKAPYAIDNGTYLYAPDKNGGPVSYGIKLWNVGYTSGTASNPGAVYQAAIGDGTFANSNTNQNLFDNMLDGIHADNGNMSLQNNVFMNMRNDGVYANAANIPSTSTTFLGVLQLNQGANAGFINEFWGCNYSCVEANNYDVVQGWSCKMLSNHTTLSANNWGYKLNMNLYLNADIENNLIYNINTGVDIRTTGQKYTQNPTPVANITVRANNILANTSNTTSGFVNLGISINNILNAPNTNSIYTGYVHANYNTIDAYNGIYINNEKLQYPTADSNVDIHLENMGAIVPPNTMQYGINQSNCRYGTIFFNRSIRGNTSTLYSYTKGAYFSFSSFGTMGCNVEQNIGNGFEFSGTPPQLNSKWLTNVMAGNLKGFVVNNTLIGQQGNSSTPAGNVWSSGSWWSASLQHYQTFTFANTYPACSSAVYVGSLNDPTINGAQPVFPKYIYSHNPVVGPPAYPPSLYYSTGPTPNCGKRPALAANGNVTTDYLPMLEMVATNTAGYLQNEGITAWMSQMELYSYLKQDTTLIDSSAILQEFMTMAGSSRFAYLANIEKLLSEGHYGSAQCQLNNTGMQSATGYTYGSTGAVLCDSSSADSIVQHYVSFYGLYKRYMQSTLSSSDSSEIALLANLCPNTSGAVVYQARALYTTVFEDPHTWDDDLSCGIVTDTTGYSATDSTGDGGEGRKARPTSPGLSKGEGIQSYALYPNPNDGNMMLIQKIVDENPVSVNVLNAEGQNIYKRDILLAGGGSTLKLENLSPGLYLIMIRDASGKNYTLKFIVN